MVKAICEIADQVNNYAYNSISPWWQHVREILLECPKTLGVLVAIVCKTVAVNFRNFDEVILANIMQNTMYALKYY